MIPDSFPAPVGIAAVFTGAGVVPLAGPLVGTVVLPCCAKSMLAERLVGLRILFSNHPRLLQVTVQSGSYPVTKRKTWSAFVVNVAVVPFTDWVSAPVSKASESSSALPALETSDVVPLALPVAPSC